VGTRSINLKNIKISVVKKILMAIMLIGRFPIKEKDIRKRGRLRKRLKGD
jgi:hypothetical protein